MGWVAGVVEKYNPHAKIRHDLWGWCDIVALALDEHSVYFIQVTSGSNHAARVAKIKEWPHLSDLLYAHADVEVWSYSQRVVKNKDGSKAKNKKWTLRREKVE